MVDHHHHHQRCSHLGADGARTRHHLPLNPHILGSGGLLAQSGPSAETIEDALGVVQTIVLYVGTVAFAISAALLAGRRRMNVAGVVVFGVLVSVGGGTARVVLLGLLPVGGVPTFAVRSDDDPEAS